MAVQVVMLSLDSWRLHQMLQLIRDVRKWVSGDLSMDWLRPFMTERQYQAGEVLFYKDEKAEDMLYIVSGRFKLVESGIELPVGAIVGELGMLSPSNVRTQTLECIEGGLILSVSYTKVEELYVQIPNSASTSSGSPARGCSRTSTSSRRGWRNRRLCWRNRRLCRSLHEGREYPRVCKSPGVAGLSVRRHHRRTGRRDPHSA